MKSKILGLLAAGLLAGPMAAQAVVFNISWTGSGGYSMTGAFSYDDSLINTGTITASALQSFMIEGFQGATSVGTFNLFVNSPLLGADTFNFNFDTIAEVFLVGGLSASGTGQNWATAPGGVSCSTTGFGFSSGNSSQGLCVNEFVFSSSIPISTPTLVATRAAVPEPGTLALLGLGLLGLGMTRRKAA